VAPHVPAALFYDRPVQFESCPRGQSVLVQSSTHHEDEVPIANALLVEPHAIVTRPIPVGVDSIVEAFFSVGSRKRR
jgi:hypothetical protein